MTVSSSHTEVMSDLADVSAMLPTMGMEGMDGMDGMDEVFSDWHLPDVPVASDSTGLSLLQSLDTLGLDSFDEIPGTQGNELLARPLNQTPSSQQEIAFDPMIQLFYQNFHGSHPIVVPRRALTGQLAQHLPFHLISAMRFIGAHYHYDHSIKELYRKAAYSAFTNSIPRNAFKVQTMLLLSIIEHAHGWEAQASQSLHRAIEVALELGMNQASFATDNSFGSPILEESFRRTYWELYVSSGLFSAIRGDSGFALHSLSSDLTLPCDEASYYEAEEMIRERRTLEDFQHRFIFGSDAPEFSTFAYRIEAVRILGLVLALNQALRHQDDVEVETIEALLSALLLGLPVWQSDAYTNSNFLDEMAFQAQMIAYLAMIYLHHPRSSIRFASFQSRTVCTRLRAVDTNPPRPDFDLHSMKMVRAADLLSNLATLPTPLRRHTPFLTCALSMTVIVHTAAGLVIPAADRKESTKARIQLAIGGLNTLGGIWPLAKMAKQQLVELYNEVNRRRLENCVEFSGSITSK